MGANPCVTAVEKIVDVSTPESPTDVDYYIMTIDNHVEVGMLTPPDPALTIKKATVDDAQKLFPLQEGYEKEEVLLNPATFKPWNSMMLFKKALQEQIIIYAEVNGEPVAKTGTNALGFDYYQIGGVYTAAPYRNQGIGTFLMKCLTKEITQRDKRLSLFVKKHNSSAIHMYKHIGFTIKEHFRIAYYRG